MPVHLNHPRAPGVPAPVDTPILRAFFRSPRAKSDASDEEVQELLGAAAGRSPVFSTVSDPVDVGVELETTWPDGGPPQPC